MNESVMWRYFKSTICRVGNENEARVPVNGVCVGDAEIDRPEKLSKPSTLTHPREKKITCIA